MRYQFIRRSLGQFPLRSLCRVMEVSASGFYAWRCRHPSARSQQQSVLVRHIQSVHDQSRGTYGNPRVHQELRARGVPGGRNQVARLMRVHQIRAKSKRRVRSTTNSQHDLSLYENILNRQFTVALPNACWVSDITYLWTAEGWLYLAVILDLFSRRIVGWALGTTLEQSLVLQALSMALQTRQPSPGLLHHSDRGSQYASHLYRAELQRFGILGSMSRKGNCWDNAVVESFFSTLKAELIRNQVYPDRAQARADIFEYSEVWYNRKRRHSTLGYVSPMEFEKRHTEFEQTSVAANQA